MNRPEANAKDDYLFLWQQYMLGISDLIGRSEVKFDPRIPRMVRFMISLIAHDEKRYQAEERFDKAIAYVNSRKDLSLDERNETIYRISATMCGELTSYVDQYKGLAHQLKVGELVNMTKEYFTTAYSDDKPKPCEPPAEELVVEEEPDCKCEEVKENGSDN